MTTVAINHQGSTTNYTGLPDGAVPVSVYRTATFTVAHIGDALRDQWLNNDFRTISLVDQSNGQLMKSPLLGSHFTRLAKDLYEGATAEIVYETGTGWIKSVNGKRWN